MSKPSHIAYVVTEPKEGSDKKPVWREVGAIWPHKNGSGFDLVLVDQISVRVASSAPNGKRNPPSRPPHKAEKGWRASRPSAPFPLTVIAFPGCTVRRSSPNPGG